MLCVSEVRGQRSGAASNFKYGGTFLCRIVAGLITQLSVAQCVCGKLAIGNVYFFICEMQKILPPSVKFTDRRRLCQ